MIVFVRVPSSREETPRCLKSEVHYESKGNYNSSAARQTRTDDPLVNSQLSFEAQYRAANLLYHAELERRNITANPRTK